MRVVTIDGPAGAGKSTVARALAEQLSWRFLDTGAMYRAVAYAALSRGIDLSDPLALSDLAETLTVRMPPGRVLLDGQDVSEAIRSPEVTVSTRFAANHPQVRRRLVQWQRAFAAEHDTVTEGRDQGTVVFPDAIRKFFLTGTPEERARRRHSELVAAGRTIPYEIVLAEMGTRDGEDQSREIAPLRPAADAVTVDTTGLTLSEVVAGLLAEVRSILERDTRP